MFFYSDGRELLNVASSISLPRLAVPVALTLFSYVLMTLSYDGIARAAERRPASMPMLRITFVSNVVNYIIATGWRTLGLRAAHVLLPSDRHPGRTRGLISFVQASSRTSRC